MFFPNWIRNHTITYTNKKLNKPTKTQKATVIHQETRNTGAKNKTNFKLGKYLPSLLVTMDDVFNNLEQLFQFYVQNLVNE